MGGMYTLSRVLATIFGSITLFGVIWFSETLSGTVRIAGVLIGTCSLGAAFLPERKLSSAETRKILITLCFLGIVSGLFLLTDDLGDFSEIEWDVITMRFLHITSLTILAVKVLQMDRKVKQ